MKVAGDSRRMGHMGLLDCGKHQHYLVEEGSTGYREQRDGKRCAGGQWRTMAVRRRACAPVGRSWRR